MFDLFPTDWKSPTTRVGISNKSGSELIDLLYKRIKSGLESMVATDNKEYYIVTATDISNLVKSLEVICGLTVPEKETPDV